jgi:O-antigen/teichoic acid export membrane protein
MTGSGDSIERASLSAARAEDVAIVAKGGATQIVGQITQRSVQFFFTVAAANILGPAGLGLYRQVAQILTISSQLGLAGYNYSAMRFIARARALGEWGGVRGAARTALGASGVASLVVAGGLVVAAEPLGRQFADRPDDVEELRNLIRLGAAYVPCFALMQVLRYCTQAYKTMVPSVMVGNVIQPLIRIAFGVGLLLAGFGVAGAVGTLTLSMAIGALVGAWYFARMITPEERAATPLVQLGAMTRFALPQGGASLLGIQSLGLGIIVLGLLSTNRAVGLFSIALALQGPGGVFLSGIVNIWAPVVADLYERGEIARLDALYKTVTRWIVTFAFPVYAALILEPDVFVVFFGSRAEEAAPIVAIVAVGNIFYSGTGPTGYVISMSGRPGINFINSVVAVVVYVGLGAWAVPRYGLVGMAWVDVGVTALVNSVRVIQAKVLVGVQPFGRSFLKPLGATLAGSAVLLAWRLIPGGSWGLDVAGIAVAAVVYLAVLRALGIDPEERYVWERIKTRARQARRSRRARRDEKAQQ